MTEPIDGREWRAVWRGRLRDACLLFQIGPLANADVMTLALGLLCLPRADWPPEASRLAGLLPPESPSADPGSCDALYAGVQNEGFDDAVALFDLVRTIDRAWPSR